MPRRSRFELLLDTTPRASRNPRHSQVITPAKEGDDSAEEKTPDEVGMDSQPSFAQSEASFAQSQASAEVSAETSADTLGNLSSSQDCLEEYPHNEDNTELPDSQETYVDLMDDGDTYDDDAQFLFETAVENETNKDMTETEPVLGSTNRLVNVDTIHEMISTKCVCRQCYLSGRGVGKITVSEITYGLATTVYVSCKDCPATEKERTFRAVPAVIGQEKSGKTVTKSRYFTQPPRFGQYVINHSMVLLMQQLGIGLEGLCSILAHVGITCTTGNYEKWKRIHDSIGEKQQNLAAKCVEENRLQEIKASELANIPKMVDPSGFERQGIVVTQDAGWTKRASGRSYTSPNGHYFQVGAHSGKIVGYNAYSTLCKTCAITKDGMPPPHRCGKNYEGNAKSMEAAASVKLTLDFFNKTTPWTGHLKNPLPPAFIHTTVMDDDSTTASNLSVSLQARLEKENQERMANNEKELKRHETTWWPWKLYGQNKTKTYLQDRGKLPLHVLPPVCFWADPGHRTKVLGKHLYEEKAKKESKIGKDIVDRLKRNFGYGVRQGVKGPRNLFKTVIRAGFDHEFDIHTHCDDAWCKAVNKPADDPVRKKYWKRDDFPDEYERLSKKYDEFLSEERLTEMYHRWDTQKNESLNKMVARTCPKDMVFCQTMQFSDRVAWIVCIDSLGDEEALLQLFNMLQIHVALPELTAFYQTKRKRRLYWKNRRHDLDLKRKRKEDQKILWRRDDIADKRSKMNGQTYGTGIALQTITETEEQATATQR